jgi:hypothetical protein
MLNDIVAVRLHRFPAQYPGYFYLRGDFGAMPPNQNRFLQETERSTLLCRNGTMRRQPSKVSVSLR